MRLKKCVAAVVAASILVMTLPVPVDAGTRHPASNTDASLPPRRPAYTLENCDLPTVLKMLANEARVDLDLDGSVRGSVNMRLEDVDAKHAIEVLAQANALDCQFAGNAYHIKATGKTDDEHKGGSKPLEGFEGFAQAFATAYDNMVDALTKPEMAEKFARYKHSYYLALIKEGFSADEALKIVIAAGDPAFSNDQKGK